MSTDRKDQPPACPGPCNRGRTADEEREPGAPVWCRACARQIRIGLPEVDRLASWLESQADGFAQPGRKGDDTRKTGKPTGPPDLSPVTDTLDALYADLSLIEIQWRSLRGLLGGTRTGPGRTAYDRARIVAFLQPNLTAILSDPAMVKTVGRVITWLIVLRRMAHAEPPRRDRPGRCPRCHMVNTLRADADTGVIHCVSCPNVITEQEYEDEVVRRPDAAVITESRRGLGLE